MSPKLRVVVDTNIMISAILLRQSVSRQAVDLARQQGVLLLSTDILAEFNAVICREKFDRYLSLGERLLLLALLTKEAETIPVTATITACRDPKDNMFLELAVSGQAHCIISGDKDLLELHPFEGIPILRPDRFLAEF